MLFVVQEMSLRSERACSGLVPDDAVVGEHLDDGGHLWK